MSNGTLSSAGAWWASSTRNARATAVGAFVIAAALVAVSVVVWVSPATSPATRVSEATQLMTQLWDLAGDNRALTAEKTALEEDLTAREAELEALRAELAAAEEALGEAEQDLGATAQALAETEHALQAALGQERTQDGPGQSGSPSPAPPSLAPPAEPAVTAPSKEELLAPASPYYGVYTEQAPFNFATFDAVADKVGAYPSLVGYFQGWDQEFRPDAVTRSWERGLLPMMTWESRPIEAQNDTNVAPEYSLPLILDGAFDEYLHDYAQDIVENGLPLAIRLNHEMNGNWYPWSEDNGAGQPINGNRPGDYAAVWRYVHDIFEEEGANEYVIWVWAPNRVNLVPTAHRSFEYLEGLYPGDEYVDWVGMSGYLRPPVTSTSRVSFDETYGLTLEYLRRLTDKPVILAEVGATENGGRKAEWVTSFFDGLSAPENRDVIGFAWFSMAITTYGEGGRTTNDWRIDSRSDSLAAFREGLLAEDSRFEPELLE